MQTDYAASPHMGIFNLYGQVMRAEIASASLLNVGVTSHYQETKYINKIVGLVSLHQFLFFVFTIKNFIY